MTDGSRTAVTSNTPEIALISDRLSKIEELCRRNGQEIASPITRSSREVAFDIGKALKNEFTQLEALLKVNAYIAPFVTRLETRGWAASPDLLKLLFEYIADRKPRVVVELGSGISTIVAGISLQRNGSGFIYSLDHEPVFAARTQCEIERLALVGSAKVYNAPLQAWTESRASSFSEAWQWYGVPQEVAMLEQIDLLIIDGPPATTSKLARYPAVPAFFTKLAANAIILLDDANRDDEATIVRAWKEEFGLKVFEYRHTEKGVSILTCSPDELLPNRI